MLIFSDGFDAMATMQDILMKWTTYYDVSTSWSYLPTGGVGGGGAIKCIHDDRYLFKKFRANGTDPQPAIRLSFWYKASGTANASDIFITLGGGDATGTHRILLTTIGTLSVSLAEGGSISYSFSTQSNICDGGWHHVQIGIVTGLSLDGEIKVWIDGVEEISETGINTYADGDPGRAVTRFEHVYFYTGDIDGSYDDIIIWDDDIGDGFVGELPAGQNTPVIETVFATADGSVSNFTPVGEVSNYLCVDDPGFHDGLTTYTYAEIPGDKDLYTNVVLDPAAVDILAVVVNTIGNSEAGATVDVRPVLKSGATEVLGNVTTVVSDFWQVQQVGAGVDPDTGLAWTKAGVEAAEFGLEIV